jgi:hypothetical protein
MRLCGYGIPDATAAATSDRNRVVLYADDEIGMDKFIVYEIPIPEEYAKTKGRRYIKVSLAFDPPTRHTRAAYLGVEMSFRLIRGKTLGEVQEHFRKRNAAVEGRHPEMGGRFDCKLDLGSNLREHGTLQSATLPMSMNPSNDYGAVYFLVVRCERQWSTDELAMQRFAVVVEMSHTQDINLYELVRTRVQAARIQIRQR